MTDHVTIPASIMPVLNDFEKSFIGQCHHLQYRTLVNRMALEPFIRDDNGKKVVYCDLVVCECTPILMWVQDGGRKTVYRMCQKHGLVFNGHLERAKKPVECHDMKRSVALAPQQISRLIARRNKLTNRRDGRINIPALNEIDAQLASVPAGENNTIDLLLGRLCAVLPSQQSERSVKRG